MSLSRNSSVRAADWLPDWLRTETPAAPAAPASNPGTNTDSHERLSPTDHAHRATSGVRQSRHDGLSQNPPRGWQDGPLDTQSTREQITSRSLGQNSVPIRDEREEPQQNFQLDNLNQNGVAIEPAPGVIVIAVDPDRDRSVKRRLHGIHLFAITISGVLGIGLYEQGGLILRLAGPLAVLLSFAFLGILAWAVMQCLAEMLCIWPISGALTVYVSEFVDVELGIAVGVAYWFTYSISFAALIAATAAEASYWTTPRGIDAGVLFLLIPILLVILNSLGIEAYGFAEVISSSLKLIFLLIVIIVMACINAGAGARKQIGTSLWSTKITVYDDAVVDTWVAAFFMSLSIAAYAYVGVEIVAASALEARVPVEKEPQRKGAVGKTVRFTAIWTSPFAALLYVLAGILVSLNIKWDDPQLPQMAWISTAASASPSAFVIVARDAGLHGLAGTLNVFLLATALTCANTNLYVSSRTLFALTRGLSGGPEQPFYVRWVAYLGKTNRRKVPLRALIFSCIFSWVPYLFLDPSNGPDTSIGTILDVLSQMGSVGVIIVWFCECWAFLRFYRCVNEESDHLRPVSMVRRWNHGTNELSDDYPYRSHGQPFTAIAAMGCCFFILTVANGASLWKQWNTNAFLSAYLTQFCFFGLWVILKYTRRAPGDRWGLVDLSNGADVAEKMKKLHQIRFRSAEERDKNAQRRFWNFWGLI